MGEVLVDMDIFFEFREGSGLGRGFEGVFLGIEGEGGVFFQG